MTVSPFPETKSGSPGSEPQLPNERIDAIRTRLQKHLEDNEEINQAKVATAINWSSAAVSTFLKGKYPANSSSLAADIDRYVNTFDRRRAATGSWKFVRTSVTKRIEQAILMAEATRKIAVIQTDSGVGATETLKNYRDANTGVVLLECDPSINTPWALLTALSAVVIDDSCRLRPADATGAIIRSLKNTDRTILVDEAHYLTNAKCIDILRRISDRSGVALVLVGNASRYQGRMGGESMLSSTTYTQFQRRSIRRLRIAAKDLTAADLRLVLSQMMSEQVFAAVLPKLQAEALTNGGIGRVVTIIQIARMLAKSQDIASKHVLKAIQVVNDDGEEDGAE